MNKYYIEIVYQTAFDEVIQIKRLEITSTTIERALKKSKDILISLLSNKYEKHIKYFYGLDFAKHYNSKSIKLIINRYLTVISYNLYDNNFNNIIDEYHD